jgi:hypothetical protein
MNPAFRNVPLFAKVYDYYQGKNLPDIQYLKNTLNAGAEQADSAGPGMFPKGYFHEVLKHLITPAARELQTKQVARSFSRQLSTILTQPTW